MGLVTVIALIYIGGPAGVICLLIGAWSFWKTPKGHSNTKAGLWVVAGALLVMTAAWLMIELANTNFGL